MNYNNGFPVTYPQMMPQMPYQQMPQPVVPQMQNPMQNAQQADNSGIVWVQGEAGAKAYPVQAGKSLLLMDAEQHQFYIKSTDQSGMPMPLRIFAYEEVVESNVPKTETKNFITREEFEQRLAELSTPKTYTKKEVKKDE